MIVAVIPARGGSKRIPKKNIRNFLGKPIIAYSIESAKKSGLFDYIIVSTDDDDIANIAKDYGASVPFVRPDSLSGDHIGTHPVMKHAVEWFVDNIGTHEKNYFCCIYPTAPFLLGSDLLKGFEKISNGNWNMVFSATRFSYSVFRSFNINKNGGVKMLFPEHYKSRSQDLPESFHDAGMFYWALAEYWISCSVAFSNKSTIVRLPEWRVQDIDTLSDWKHAEKKYKLFKV